MAVIQYTLVKLWVFEVQEVRLCDQITLVKLDPHETLKSVPKVPPKAEVSSTSIAEVRFIQLISN